MRTQHHYLTILLLLIFAQCKQQSEQEVSTVLGAAEIKQISEVRKAYTDAWLRSDSSAILSTLTRDAVLIPHHGDEPVRGLNEIRAFWWPADSPPTKVTVFSSDIEEVSGNGNMAFVRGRFRLEFEYDTLYFTNEGNFLNVLQKEEGQWKLSRLIWNDPLPVVE